MVHGGGEVTDRSFTNTFGFTMLPCKRDAGMLIDAGLSSESLFLIRIFWSGLSECVVGEKEVVTV